MGPKFQFFIYFGLILVKFKSIQEELSYNNRLFESVLETALITSERDLKATLRYQSFNHAKFTGGNHGKRKNS